jgi:hypothetical protein
MVVTKQTKERHKQILEALQGAIGAENVSDDPSFMLAYYRDWLPPGVIGMSRPPEFVTGNCYH